MRPLEDAVINDPCPDTPEWPCESPDFEVLGSLDSLTLNAGGDVDDGDYLTYGYPPGFTVRPDILATPTSQP